MLITRERILLDKGREILIECLPDIQKTPGYLGWRLVETEDFIQRRGEETEIRALFLLVKIDGDADSSLVASHIEEIEEVAYKNFADLAVEASLEGKVNIFILMDWEE